MSRLNHPSKFPRGITHGLIPGMVVLALVVGLGVAVGIPVGEKRLDAWGSWLGAFIAGIALVASAYAVMMQARQNESDAWNIALSRLGDIYESALKESWMCDILAEEVDLSGNKNASVPATSAQKIWFGSLFMAYEQVFIASLGLSSESQRVWRRYLKNQLNKPSIRAAFVYDSVGPDGASGAKDYHHEFWRFVRGKPTWRSLFRRELVYRNAAIDSSFFPKQKNNTPRTVPKISAVLTYERFAAGDVEFWIESYMDPAISKQMYAIPLERNAAVDYLSSEKTAYTVFNNGLQIGGFTVSAVTDRIGTFGFFLSKPYRGQGFGKEILRFAEKEAAKQGFLTMRADVYADNNRSIETLKTRGFRLFVWMEKNLGDPATSASESIPAGSAGRVS